MNHKKQIKGNAIFQSPGSTTATFPESITATFLGSTTAIFLGSTTSKNNPSFLFLILIACLFGTLSLKAQKTVQQANQLYFVFFSGKSIQNPSLSGEGDLSWRDMMGANTELKLDKFGEDPSERNLIDFDESFTHKSIRRREKHGILKPDYLDLPLCQDYVRQIEGLADTVRQQLRWFNAVSIAASPGQIEKIRALPFVIEVRAFGENKLLPAEISLTKKTLSKPAFSEFQDKDLPYGSLRDNLLERGQGSQLENFSANRREGKILDNQEDEKFLDTLLSLERKQMNLDAFKNAGLDGSGVTIAIFDAGFRKADQHEAFAHLWAANKPGGGEDQILATKDFFGRKKPPFGHSSHGSNVLSCIAGKKGEAWIGAAPGADFLLARTEHNLTEFINEEDNWLAAMEWADRQGADIISSSLGYTKPRYKFENLDGHQALVTQAAAIATRKGMLVVNSAGNQGDEKFHYLGAPADADSVLTVGATYPMVKIFAKFSSYGPNARGVLKPNVTAPGFALVAKPSGGYQMATGTSFSAPLVSGFAACLMQLFPDATNMEVFRMIVQSGHLFPYFDYVHGFGVPDAASFFRDKDEQKIEIKPTFQVISQNDTLYFILDTEIVNDSARCAKGLPFHLHIEKKPGVLAGFRSELIRYKQSYFRIPEKLLEKGKIRVWFEGYLGEIRPGDLGND